MYSGRTIASNGDLKKGRGQMGTKIMPTASNMANEGTIAESKAVESEQGLPLQNKRANEKRTTDID